MCGGELIFCVQFIAITFLVLLLQKRNTFLPVARTPKRQIFAINSSSRMACTHRANCDCFTTRHDMSWESKETNKTIYWLKVVVRVQLRQFTREDQRQPTLWLQMKSFQWFIVSLRCRKWINRTEYRQTDKLMRDVFNSWLKCSHDLFHSLPISGRVRACVSCSWNINTRRRRKRNCVWLFINRLRSHQSANKQFSGNLSKISEMPINNLAAWSVQCTNEIAVRTLCARLRCACASLCIEFSVYFRCCVFPSWWPFRRYSTAYECRLSLHHPSSAMCHVVPYGSTRSTLAQLVSAFCHF